MTHELRRIAPLRAANIVAVVHCLMLTAAAFVMLPLVSLVPTPPPRPGQPDPAAAIQLLRWLLLFYPVLGLTFGWLIGCLGAAAYNVVRRWTGGFLVEIEAQGRGA